MISSGHTWYERDKHEQRLTHFYTTSIPCIDAKISLKAELVDLALLRLWYLFLKTTAIDNLNIDYYLKVC